MACGNNEVSREGLSSQPAPLRHPEPAFPRANGDNQYYSKYVFHPDRPEEGRLDRFVDKDGQPTIQRPHVHEIHNQKNNEVIIVLTTTGEKGVKGHPEERILDNPSGQEVNETVDELRGRLT